MKLVEQKSDREWTESSLLCRTNRTRRHRLKLAAPVGDFDLLSLCHIVSRPNSKGYGGVRPGFLIFRQYDASRDEFAWRIDVVLEESESLPYDAKLQLINAAGEVAELDQCLYGDPVDFRDALPTCKPFPPCEAK